MPATSLQQQITSALLPVLAEFNVAGTVTTATVKRKDSAGVVQTLGTASPIYVLEEQPSELAKALSQSAATLRTRWTLYAAVSALTFPKIGGGTATIQVGDTITYSTGHAFLVQGLDYDELPGAVAGRLEKQPYT